MVAMKTEASRRHQEEYPLKPLEGGLGQRLEEELEAYKQAMEAKIAPPPLALAGRKDDLGKPRYELLAPEALEGTSRILTFGAAKYSDRNWEKGMKWSRVFGALMRHLWAWWRGEAKDAESGESHLHHAACCLMFLQAYEVRKVGEDDRTLPNSTTLKTL